MSDADDNAALYISGDVTTCTTDFMVIGFQPGEKVTTILRVICTLISVSIISSWLNKRVVGKYLLFFSHWLSGLFHQLAEMALSQMVLLCFVKTNALIAIDILKFIELTAGNMLAVTNVAICVNLALIVSSHHTMSSVKSVTSPRRILGFLLISVMATAAVVPFWESMIVSGTLIWSLSKDPSKHQWVMISTFFVELLAGAIMAVIGTLLVVFRWPELCQVWQIHRRIKYYIMLSGIATTVDLAIGIGGVVFVLNPSYQPGLTMVTWSMRHVHIALDTLVLYSALGVTTKAEVESPSLDVRISGTGPMPKPCQASSLGRQRGTVPCGPNCVSPGAV